MLPARHTHHPKLIPLLTVTYKELQIFNGIF